MPMDEMTADIFVKSQGPNKTKLTMRMNFTMKYGCIGRLMGSAMIKPMMTGKISNVEAALDHHLKTGQLIPKGWKPSKKQ